jgi:hypothetical protein
MSVLPQETQAALPRHPRRPWLTVFGSARFFLALFRFALRTQPSDTLEMIALKHKMRASVLREALFGTALATAVIVLWTRGWRPAWPRFGNQR